MGCCCPKEEKNGPREQIAEINPDRSCTDTICCIFYVLFVCFLIYCSVYGFIYGDISKIAQPYDVDSNACGKGDVEDFPYLFFTEYADDAQNVKGTVCVKECLSDPKDSYECYPNSEVTNCGTIAYYPTILPESLT